MLGVGGGMAFAGRQDLTLAREADDGVLTQQHRGLSAAPGPILGASLTAWFDQWPALGIRVDGLRWTTRLHGSEALPIDTRQERWAVLFGPVARVFLDPARGTVAYAGIGLGLSRTRIPGGRGTGGPSLGLVAGLAAPVGPRWGMRLEVRYLVTGDADADPAADPRAEASGHHAGNRARWRHGPHLDTEFLPVMVWIDWRF